MTRAQLILMSGGIVTFVVLGYCGVSVGNPE